MMKISQGVLCFFVLCSFLLRCNDNETENLPDTVYDVYGCIERGWQEYNKMDYAAAKFYFEQGTGLDAQNAECYLGLGWSSLKAGAVNDAQSYFNMALDYSKPSENLIVRADAFAGLSLLYYSSVANSGLDTLNISQTIAYLKAIEYADSTLALIDDYQTDHDPEFDKYSLQTIMVSAYFTLDRISDALSVIEDNGASQITLDTVTALVPLEADVYGNVYGKLKDGGCLKIISMQDKSVIFNDGQSISLDYTPNEEARYYDYNLENGSRLVFPSIDSYTYFGKVDTVELIGSLLENPEYYLNLNRGGVFYIDNVICEATGQNITFEILNNDETNNPYSNIIRLYNTSYQENNRYIVFYLYRLYEIQYIRTDDYLELLMLIESYL